VDPETRPEAHSADLSRPSVRVSLALLAAARGAYNLAVKAAYTVAGLGIIAYLIALGWAQSRPPRKARRR
jgi:hypothetical protein